jgi:hypothetical protein
MLCACGRRFKVTNTHTKGHIRVRRMECGNVSCKPRVSIEVLTPAKMPSASTLIAHKGIEAQVKKALSPFYACVTAL